MKNRPSKSSRAPLRLILIGSVVIASGCRQEQVANPPVDAQNEQAEGQDPQLQNQPAQEQARNDRVTHTGYRPVWPIFGTNTGWFSSSSSSRNWHGTSSHFSSSPSSISSHSSTSTIHSGSSTHTSTPSHTSSSSHSVSRGGFGGHASASS